MGSYILLAMPASCLTARGGNQPWIRNVWLLFGLWGNSTIRSSSYRSTTGLPTEKIWTRQNYVPAELDPSCRQSIEMAMVGLISLAKNTHQTTLSLHQAGKNRVMFMPKMFRWYPSWMIILRWRENMLSSSLAHPGPSSMCIWAPTVAIGLLWLATTPCGDRGIATDNGWTDKRGISRSPAVDPSPSLFCDCTCNMLCVVL